MVEKKKRRRSTSAKLNSLSKIALSAKRDAIVQESDCDPNVVFSQAIALNEREGGVPYVAVIKSGQSTKKLMKKDHQIRRREKGTMYVLNLIIQTMLRNMANGASASMIADGKLTVNPLRAAGAIENLGEEEEAQTSLFDQEFGGGDKGQIGGQQSHFNHSKR